MIAKKISVNAAALLIAVFFAFPTYWMVSSALKPTRDLLSTGYDLIPFSVTPANFATAWAKPGFLQSLGNSLMVSLAAVAGAILVGLLAAVAMSRLRFRGRKSFVLLMLVAQLAPFEALLIPMFLMMRDLDLLDKLPSLALIYFAVTLPFCAWTLRGFVNGIPLELEEAAMVDGCGRWGAFRRVTLPLLGPGLVATSVFAFVTAWNEFLFALSLMKDQTKETLPVWLSGFQTNFGTDWGGAMAASALFTLPVLVFFLIVQRKMVGGVTAGAVKG
ncbi:carbohydrate ABC transporter permease [Actinosynnema sp. NPDC047251]|uniref:ABC-type transporter, permease subunit n=1 Tax=Saccharothrix espanaensis (strain ATCC 51144 / DSM 44229 / JCM 9112 / NBRC 15066 / NRRL 15764) TaxID=1179773 RepID=K0JNU1_SACES|nr:carbohydrate ABC transporter permease [Saccharothrix espanaensis]CCH27775.1 ABC-type transporter, permease subunit [Saccharothrix espanaensis DSM 44229]